MTDIAIRMMVIKYVAGLREGGFTKLSGEPLGFGSRGTVYDFLKLENMLSSNFKDG